MSRYASRASPSLPALVLLGVLAAVTIATILSTPWIFTNDGAQHVHSAELERTWGEDPASEALLQRSHPPTSNGFSLLYRVFAGPLGWRHASQVVLVVLALSWMGGFAALVHNAPYINNEAVIGCADVAEAANERNCRRNRYHICHGS